MNQRQILIAPNAFKHSLSALEAALAIEEGFRQSQLECTCTCFPIGDGGDGTGELMIHKQEAHRIWVTVQDPFGQPIQASFGLIRATQTAIIELADASGLRLVGPEALNPMLATTYGTGQLIRSALDQGVSRLVLCIGGSATVDGGTGILRALGVRFLDTAGNELYNPQELLSLVSIDTSGLDTRLQDCQLTILCDVENRLLGQQGAAAVFGPQKGATPTMVQQLETVLSTLADRLYTQTGQDIATLRYGGAAGGVAAGLCGVLGASLVNGIEFFLDFTGFNEALTNADVVITGEGSLDTQTLHGKGPFGVAYRAKQKNLPVIGLAGKVPLAPDDDLQAYFDVLLAIGHEPSDLPTALPLTRQNLVRTSCQLGNLMAAGLSSK